MKKQSKQIFVHLKPEMYTRFEKLASGYGLRPSEMIRFLIYQKLSLIENK